VDEDFSISEFDALPRDKVLELLVQCISQLSPTQKTILALYYHEDLEPAEIAACVGLTEGEFDQVRAETVVLLRTMLTAQIGLPELPVSLDEPQDADGADVLLNG
jgi:DNA-directed RNA polymerase specialized sigma24 family protein